MRLMKIKGPATIADLLRMPKDGRKYELVDGEIVVSPALRELRNPWAS